MSYKKFMKNRDKTTKDLYLSIYTNYEREFYKMFSNSLNFKGDDVDHRQSWFIKWNLWAKGSVAMYKDNLVGNAIYTPYATGERDIYRYPDKVVLINNKGVEWIPSETLIVDKDVVLMVMIPDVYPGKGVPLKAIIEPYVERLTQVEMVINTNLHTHKMPFLVGISPDDEEKAKEIVNAILNNELVVFLDSDRLNLVKTLTTQTPYIIDKLWQYRTDLINDILTKLGINNVPLEKRERLVSDEVNSNNSLIALNKDGFIDNIKEDCKRAREILGIDIDVESNVIEPEHVKDIASEEKEDNENV